VTADQDPPERGISHSDALRLRAEHYRRLAGGAIDAGIRDLYTQMSQLIGERAELARKRSQFLDETALGRK
jgi:hypothetical protein